MGNAMMPEEAIVYITSSTIAPSSLVPSTHGVTAEVTNFSESGGEEDVESTPVFGGGNIDKTKPRSQIEVSFDIVMRYDSDSAKVLKWDAMKYGTITSDEVTSAGSPEVKRIYVQWSDGTNYYTRAYNNAKAVTFEPESAADDFLKGTITFKLSPTTAEGAANLKIAEKAATAMTW